MNNKSDKKIIKRNQILKDSIYLMYLNGYNGTSVKDITDAAKIPKGSFYNYFADKIEYAIYAVEYYSTIVSYDAMKNLKDKSLDPIDRILGMFKVGIEKVKSEGLRYGCFLGNLSQEMGDVNEIISKTVRSIDNERFQLILENLTEAKQLGKLESIIPLKILANTILNSWQGSLVRMKMDENQEALDGFYLVLKDVLLK